VLAMPLGWDRESRSRGAGLRTFPLVAAGSCGFLMLGQVVLQGSESHARLMYGLMTGIGFIGGGSILKDGGSVTGTATAASIWNTGALGAAVAWQRYEIAVVLSLINFLTLRYVRSLKPLVRGSGAD
jgi:putative Mg2+ transporter-C (MgtC) family protein